ncbi:hypothetical protein PUNSTDRAFT_63042 [Punctularia strigosozonata HHB-11173 SS5]|uniref:uncharacterized protein n=1 Tax=Punctularia strigosozonata (strain HHB-11173) TaxID=741275 RepID=UPI00044174C0|nr:uncharacterized protein PUNSTDRAFT_63042 [Punctularia strigosozonata HHB-11173 SS5]EIN11981.1 hypothetical protein PUNSTDRAFT_63042 [Punctularia strigosozonata HHB-11173 SS5]
MSHTSLPIVNPTPSGSNSAPFSTDERVYLSKETNTWRFEADDGTEMEWDVGKNAWLPVLDDDVVKSQQAAYSVAGVDEEAPAAPVAKRLNKKRKEPEDYTSATQSTDPVNIKKAKVKPPKAAGERKSKNTAVYVTQLPLDTTHDELIERFRKFGVLEEDDDGEPKVKMYAKDDGTFSGEALVVYFKEESVTLAETMLDDAELRIGDPSTRMKVAKADFGHKQGDDHAKADGEAAGHAPRKTIDRKKATRRINNMKKKLEEWDDEDAFGPAKTEEDESKTINKNSRVVVLKYMFTLQELEEDPALLLDLKEDVREECETLGEVTNVVLYDKEPDGIMTVKFRDSISARACVLRMNGRFFAGRRIEASLYAGRQRFKRGNAGADLVEGDDEEAEKKRLDQFAQWLMAEGD